MTRAISLRRSSATRTLPPASENLIAFDSRFQMICCMRVGSPATTARSAIAARRGECLSCRPASRTVSSALSMTPSQFDRLVAERQLSGDDFGEVEQVVDQRRLRLARRADRAAGRCASCRASSPPRVNMRDQPRIAVSGVRSSCDSVARN